MGAFVSPKDTYRIPLTLEDCPSLDKEEWVDVRKGMSTKEMIAMQNAEGIDSGVVLLKQVIQAWSFVDGEDVPVPITDEIIDTLQLEVVLHLLAVVQEKLPLANQPAQSETTQDS